MLTPDNLPSDVVSVREFGAHQVILTVDNSDSSPNSQDPVSVYLEIGDAKKLLKQLYTAFPEMETPAQALANGYKRAKARIQFPVCACRFADDGETLLSPCRAHLEWAKQLGVTPPVKREL